MLGIVIGVASVIAITTLGRSATISVQKEIARSGLYTLVVQVRTDDPKLLRIFNPELAGRLLREVQGIELVMPLFPRTSLMQYEGRQHKGNVMAVGEAAPRIFDLGLSEGRFLTSMDMERRATVVVLGAEAARSLFPTSEAVGRSIRLHFDTARSFKVIGVIDTRPDAMGLSFDTSVFVPFETYSRRVQPITRVPRYVVRTAEEADVIEVSNRIEEYFYGLTGSRTAVRLLSPSTVAEMFDTVTATLNAFLTGIAAISLLVGGIGIMNIMFVSVTERTKEIGIRKALGASPRVIRGQFLTEAVTLTLFGGVIGMLVGTLLSWLGTWMLGWSFSPSPFAYPLALVFSSTVGIFFGLQPAIRASRLDPVQALTYE